jgi:hypothetical protein
MHKLKGGNLDLDLCSGDSISWKQDPCPWNVAEKTNNHKCAVKNTSICEYFAGLGDGDNLDTVLCIYPEKRIIKIN